MDTGPGPASATQPLDALATQPIDDVLAPDDAVAVADDEPNQGNPVFTTQPITELGKKTADIQATLPDRFADPSIIPGYGRPKHANPMYQTTSSSYGANGPSTFTSPRAFHSRTNGFTTHLANAGMPCNRSLNTSMDKSKVHHELDSSTTSHH
jgi:hypothetical protein